MTNCVDYSSGASVFAARADSLGGDIQRVAAVTGDDDASITRFVECGGPAPGVEVRIVGGARRTAILPERRSCNAGQRSKFIRASGKHNRKNQIRYQ